MTSAFGFLVKFLVLVVVLVAIAAGYSLVTGNDLPVLGMSVVEAFGPREKPAEDSKKLPDDYVWAPLAIRNVPAYSRVTRDDLYDPKTYQPKLVPVRKSSVEEQGIMTDPNVIAGRVLKSQKTRDYVFREADFLPKGTRSGLSAGIPPGKRGFIIDVSDVKGILGLNPGDRFDLISTIAVDEKSQGTGFPKFSGVYGPQMELLAKLENITKQASVKVVVQNGLVVTPVRARAMPTSSTSLMSGTTNSAMIVQEVYIAVEPEEVSALSEALSVGARLTCTPRSGHPDDPVDSETPDLKPRSPFGGGLLGDGDDEGARLSIIETVVGDKRQLVPVRIGGRTDEDR